jgi:hypothetical protein
MNDPKSTRRRFGRRAIKLGRHGAIASNEASSCEVVFANDIKFNRPQLAILHTGSNLIKLLAAIADSGFSPERKGRVCSFQPEMFPQFNAGLHLLSPALKSSGSIDFLPSGFDTIRSQANVAFLLFMSETQIDWDGEANLVRGRNQTGPPWRQEKRNPPAAGSMAILEFITSPLRTPAPVEY